MNKLGFINKEFGFKKSFFGWAKLLQNTPAPVASNIKYGRLYNWYTIINPLFAPTGWHVPSASEYNTLSETLGGNAVSGGKLKTTGFDYWLDPNTGASNTSKFNGIGGGFRYSYGAFDYINAYGQYLTTTLDRFNTYAAFMELTYSAIYYFMATASTGKNSGHSIRLIKDNAVLVPQLIDLDGNIYSTAKIGNQVWLANNWACTKLNDGAPITNTPVDADWTNGYGPTDPIYCNYNNDENNVFL
jgi:uncharacterized protein (TIGR02145 family)